MATKEILTGISYYQYHFFAAVTFCGYAVYHYFAGNPYVAMTTGGATVGILMLIASRMRNKDSEVIRETILVLIILAVLSACYFLGMRGIAWLFPLVIGIFFNYANRSALMISSTATCLGLLLALHTVSLEWVLRMFVPLVFTVGFAYLYRITIEKEQSALQKEANEDYLTGICNRRSFHSWLERAVDIHREIDSFLAVYYLDVDDFKYINDTYGHEFGDRVLQQVSQRLIKSTRQTDQVCRGEEHQFARIAGDEFVVAATHLHCDHHVDSIARRLLASINAPMKIDKFELKLSTSIGIAVFKTSEACAESILRDADAAMYRSKEQGKNRITYFDADIANQIQEKQRIALGIEEALREQAFFLNYMPIFRLHASGEQVLAGAEVLVRCRSAYLAEVGPEKFIPVAEEFGTIKNIDLYVVEHAFRAISSVLDQLPADFILAVNISAKELHNSDFPDLVEGLARRYAIPPGMIELEITETSFVAHDEASIDMLSRLKDKGFKLSLDDFGTGYTAFSQLRHYPVDTLKIDRSFVWNINDENQTQETMVDVILSLAKLYDLKIVAEGVENQVQLDYLVNAQCDYFQGFYLSKPLTWETLNQKYLTRAA